MLDRMGTERLKHHARWETVCVLERGSVMYECYLYRLSVMQIKKENATLKILSLYSNRITDEGEAALWAAKQVFSLI